MRRLIGGAACRSRSCRGEVRCWVECGRPRGGAAWVECGKRGGSHVLSMWSGFRFQSIKSFRLSTRPRAAHTAARRSSPTRIHMRHTTLSHSFSLASRSHVHSLHFHSRLLLSRTAYSSHRHLLPPRRRRSSSPPSPHETPMCCRCRLAASWMNRSASAGVHSLTVDAFLACVTPKHLCAVPMSSGRNVVVMNCAWLSEA